MRISVVTVAFDAARTIGDTLRSVAAQTHGDIEHIVIDGGSRDATMAVVGEFPHVACAVSEPDRGIYDAMNKGLRLATGDAVGFLNADDFYCREDAVARIARGLEQSGADAVTGAVALVDRADSAKVRRFYPSTGYRPWMLRFGHMPPHPTLYARRDALLRIGEFDAAMRIAADFEMIVRLYNSGARVHALPDTLVGFRDGGTSTRDFDAKLRMNREILASLRRNGIWSAAPLLWARYPFKALQYLGKARDYRVPAFLD
ncbi:MAG: glycosyltransferase family 2 protein [Sphingomonas sp.]